MSKLSLFRRNKEEEQTVNTSYFLILIFAVIALIAAFTLSMEEIHLMKNPDAVLSCTLNVVLNCASVMKTWQASVFFGIPNMFIGLMAFPVLITVTIAALWGGAKLKRGFLIAMNIGVLLGTIFAYWLFFNSVYVIEVLCPWCLIVTFSCTMILAATTHLGLRENIWNLAAGTNKKVQKFLKSGYHQLIVASWIVLMIVLVFLKFGTALFAS